MLPNEKKTSHVEDRSALQNRCRGVCIFLEIIIGVRPSASATSEHNGAIEKLVEIPSHQLTANDATLQLRGFIGLPKADAPCAASLASPDLVKDALDLIDMHATLEGNVFHVSLQVAEYSSRETELQLAAKQTKRTVI